MAIDHVHSTADMDVQTLRAFVAEQLQVIVQQSVVITCHERTITEREARITVLTAQIARLRRALFDETMAADIAAVEAELDALQSPAATTPSDRPRQSLKRRPLPENLERIETRHEPDRCTCG